MRTCAYERRPPSAAVIAFRRLDLYDSSAEISEHHGRVRTGERP